jgi:hypothetical protein
MTIGCGVVVNSTASAPDEALHVTGGGCLNASVIKVVGDYSQSDCYDKAEPFQGTEPVSNPLEGKFSAPPEVSWPCEPTANLVVDALNSPYDLPAGLHCKKIDVKNDGILRLAPGTHVLEKGISAVGGIIQEQPGSTGITLYFGPDTKSSETIKFSSDPIVTLSAPTTGPYAHLLIYVDEAATGNVQHNLTAHADSVFNGLIYMPGHDIDFSGSSDTMGETVMIIADEIKLSGDANFSNLSTIPFFLNQEDLKPRLSE